MNIKDLQSKENPTWCPGCGDYGILAAVKSALVELSSAPGLDVRPENTVIVTGIGCGSKINHYVKVYGFEGLHGRPLPVATAVKLCNPSLNVIAVGGDGDGYGLGMGHFIHSARRNLNITYIVEDNQVYGLTTGQTSPTSAKGTKSKSTPFGAIELPANPLALALSAGATFVARGYAGDLPHLTALIAAGVAHPGFSLIDVLQPCVTFNKVNTYDFFGKKVYKLGVSDGNTVGGDKYNGGKAIGSGLNVEGLTLSEAIEKSYEWDDKIPLGVFYKEDRPTYEEMEIGLKNGKPVDVPVDPVEIEELMEEFM